MRRLALLGLIAACHADPRFATLPEVEHPVRDPARIVDMTFDNGLRVALLRDPRAQLASIDLRFDAGVADDTKPGLALIVGELLAGRSGDAELTTSVDVDLDRIDVATTAVDLDSALELAAKRLETTCDDFDPYALDAAREHATTALTGVPPTLTSAVWGFGHPYGHGLGDPHALAAITTDDACAFYRANVGPASAVLVVTGAFDDHFADRLRARFSRIAKRELARRAPIPELPAGKQRVTVWGLAKPTAALAFAVPAHDAPEQVIAELAAREIQTWDKDLHVALVGGRRGRALIIALEGDRESDLPRLHDKLNDLISRSYSLDVDSHSNATSEDSLDAAMLLDDPFARGADVADLVAAGGVVERLDRAKSWTMIRVTYHWMRLHVAEGKPHVLDLIPAQPASGGSIELLADPATTTSKGLAAATAPIAAIPTRAIARPVIDYTLDNGLRVVLAPDPLSTIVDARLVLPVGSRDEPEPGAATRAALELEGADPSDWSGGEHVLWYAKHESIQDATVTPERTRFRVVGFAGLAEWHVWALAYRVTTGRYENGTGALARWKTHYVPRGATLIVSGGFDPAAIRTTIERWLGPWRAIDPRPLAHTADPTKPLVEVADDKSLALELGYTASAVSPAAGLVVAAIADRRIAAATRGAMDASTSYDAIDRRIAIEGELDPAGIDQALPAIDRELASLRSDAVPDRELERARRAVIAMRLGSTLPASGRARDLEERALTGEPLQGPDPIVAEVEKLTADDARAAAAALFDRASRSVAVHATRPDGVHVLRTLGIDPNAALWR
ncbi:MAG TPA: insulinase family protein [Kofleriaceae bacterium]